jgi:hypothetical protein
MCLLYQQTAKTKFSNEFFKGVYARNRDGIGVMWQADGKMHTEKFLPKNYKEALEFIRKFDGMEAAVHWRMRTHGDIDLLNCHPYEIRRGLYLMHNGVLATGNRKDTTKSDTWHYIRDYLSVFPTNMLFLPQVVAMIEAHIGSGNKFILMDKHQSVIVGKPRGVQYKDAWLSNTYAWDSSVLYKGAKTTKSTWTTKKTSAWEGYDDYLPDAVQVFKGFLTREDVEAFEAEFGEPEMEWLVDQVIKGELTKWEASKYVLECLTKEFSDENAF